MSHLPRHEASPHIREQSQKEFEHYVVRAAKKRIDQINAQRKKRYKLEVCRIVEELEATGIDAQEMHVIMDKFEDRDHRCAIDKPTNWVCAAISRALAENSTKPKHGPEVELSSGVKNLLRQSVDYLNGKGGGYDDSINYDEVAVAVAGLHESDVAPIFERLLNMQYKVNAPTAWICHAFCRISSEQSKQEELQSCLSSEAAKLVRRSVEWLNEQYDFEGFIEHDVVARAAKGLEEDDIADVFKEVSSRIRNANPTPQICRSLAKAKEKKLRARKAEELPPWKRNRQV